MNKQNMNKKVELTTFLHTRSMCVPLKGLIFISFVDVKLSFRMIKKSQLNHTLTHITAGIGEKVNKEVKNETHQSKNKNHTNDVRSRPLRSHSLLLS